MHVQDENEELEIQKLSFATVLYYQMDIEIHYSKTNGKRNAKSRKKKQFTKYITENL